MKNACICVCVLFGRNYELGKEGEWKREWEKGGGKNRYKKGSFFYVCVLCAYVYFSKRKWVYFLSG